MPIRVAPCASARCGRTAAKGRWHAAWLLAALLLPAAGVGAQVFEVRGRFLYQDKAWGYDGWTGAKPLRPIRRADVVVRHAVTKQVLGAGSTGPDGSFAIQAHATQPTDVFVSCEADTHLAHDFQRVRVATHANIEYATHSQVFAAHDPKLPLDIGTWISDPLSINGEEGDPFNLLDTAVSALEVVTGPPFDAAPVPQTLRLVWPNPGGSYSSGSTAFVHASDGYDDAVVLHELGHLVLTHWSDDDSQGGPHWFGDSDQDPRLAFSEGFATAFGGYVQHALGREALYVDCSGSAQVGGVHLRLALESAQPWAALCYGEADEVAVACTLFDLLDDEAAADGTPGRDDDGFVLDTSVLGQSPPGAFWSLLTGALKQVPALAQHDAWDEWLLCYADQPHLAALKAVFAERRIRFEADGHEPDGTPALAVPTPAVTGLSWSGKRTLYAPPASGPAPGTGDVDYHAVPLVAGDLVEVRTRYPLDAADAETECDPYVELYSPSGALHAADESSGPGRNALLAAVPIPVSGTWLVKVGTHATLRRYGRYELRVRYLRKNLPPVLQSGPSAFPEVVVSGGSALLSALAIDPDGSVAPSYAWTALDGGTLTGTGADVRFIAPAVSAPADFRVALLVTDAPGATVSGEVTLTVVPGTGGLCGAAASWQVLGSGKPGAGGTPALTGVGLPVVPGGGFALHATGLTPRHAGVLVFGFSQLGVPFDGGVLWPAPDLLLPVLADGSGTLTAPFALPGEALLCGLGVTVQLVLPDDPGAAGPGHSAQSNGLHVLFGD